jgi:hypothetical protein
MHEVRCDLVDWGANIRQSTPRFGVRQSSLCRRDQDRHRLTKEGMVET